MPKVSSADEVLALVDAMAAHGAPDHTALWAMVETPRAMLHAEEIAAASERLTVLVMGTNDLAKELHVEHVQGRAPLLTGLSLALLAATGGTPVQAAAAQLLVLIGLLATQTITVVVAARLVRSGRLLPSELRTHLPD